MGGDSETDDSAPPVGSVLPIGARLLHFAHQWTRHIKDPWVCEVVSQGVRLTFTSPPLLTRFPVFTTTPQDIEKADVLRMEVIALFQKQATEVVGDESSPGFYSRLFLVPKATGGWRPVIDLSLLNKYIYCPSFKMETSTSLRRSVAPGDFAVSLDLKDAYFHIPINPSARRYLRFAFEGQVFQFRALPFGLNISPWIFTRLMDTVMATARRTSSSQHSNYLDDLLLKNPTPSLLIQDRDALLSLLASLGWMVNREKSDLTPSQTFSHLGMLFQTDHNKVSLTQKRITTLVEAVSQMLIQKGGPVRFWLRALGLMNAASDLLLFGKRNYRRLQLHLLSNWSPASQDLERWLMLPADLTSEVSKWLDTEWLLAGVPLSLPSPRLSLCFDASTTGWGAHLLPEFLVAQGKWMELESQQHINWLELKAVWYALLHWQTLVSGESVSVMSDNSTVVAYLQKQGGTKSPILCRLTIDLLSWCESKDIQLIARHIPGKLNVIADSLSRQDQVLHTEWSLKESAFQLICQKWERPLIDLFATR